MNDDTPGLGVSFGIDFGDSFGGLKTLDDLIGATAARAVNEFRRIQGAVAGGMDLKAASQEWVALGRETRSAAQEMAKVEREIEGLTRTLERQNSTFGMSRQEIQSAKVAAAALKAEQLGMTEAVGRLRAEETLLNQQRASAVARAEAEAQATRSAAMAYNMFEAAARKGMDALRQAEAAERAFQAERHAQEVRSAALAHQLFEARVRDGARAMREAEAAARALELEKVAQDARSAALGFQMFEAHARQMAQAAREAAAAEATIAREAAEVRAALDPMYAAQRRFDDEMTRADRLLKAGAISQREYAQETQRAREALGAHARQVAGAGEDVARDTRRFAQGVDDIERSVRRQGFAVQQLAIQSPDIIQGLLTGQKPMTVLIQQGGQLVQIAMMAQGGIRGFASEIGMFALRFAPLIGLIGAATAGFALFNRWVNEGVKNDDLTRDLGKITGGANATKAELFKLKDETVTWADTSKAMFEVVGKDVMSVFVGDMKSMGKDVKDLLDDITSYGRQALAGMYAGVAGMKSYLGELEKGGFTGLAKTLIGQGDPKLLEKTFGAAYDTADKYLTKLGGRIRKAAVDNARDRLADKIGFNNPPKPKTDQHAETLEREARAQEAQIAGLYKVAEAYRVSGAAALTAEAETKATTAAITKQGEIAAFVDRQIRLTIAQRIADSAKSAAAMREQAEQQDLVNTAVADGVIPAERAAALLKDRMADLPLLTALEAARTLKGQEGTKAVQEATKALADSRAARDRLTDSERRAALQAAQSASDDRLAALREEIRLIGETDAARARSLAIFNATQEAVRTNRTGPDGARWIETQGEIAAAQVELQVKTDLANEALERQADLLDEIAGNAANAARGMADAFGEAGRALGDTAAIFSRYLADQQRVADAHERRLRYLKQLPASEQRSAEIARENALFERRNMTAQIGLFGDMTSAAKGFFDEKSKGYAVVSAAEKAFRAIEFALSVKAMAQNALETGKSIAMSAAKAAAHGVTAVAHAIASLPFPANLAAGAATIAALAAIGIQVAGAIGGGGRNTLAKANTGTGTVLGDPDKQSASIKNAIDGLKDVDLLMLTYSRQMANSLRTIEGQIGGVASLVVRAGNVNADATISEGFQKNLIGSVLSKIPLIGGILGGLFGSKTEIVGGGLYGKAQSLGSILNNGFDASYYTDSKKTSKFLGITTGTKYSTSYTGADAALENQFTMILREFNTAMVAAAGPLGVATDDITSRLNNMVIDIGKVDLKGLTGEQIQEKLTAIFGAAADRMASGAFPGFERFQKVGEGLFETIVRVSSTVEQVTASLDTLGTSARGLSVDAKVGLAGEFESLSVMQSAIDAYADAFYTPAERNAAKLAQLGTVITGLGATMPDTVAGFRALVEAQNLNTEAGRATYATLIQLAPAFAELKGAMEGAKSAADILSERQDLERQLLELRGDTTAIRALDLAKLDASNRALQQEIWAVKDAQDAAKAAEELRQAWASVGDGIKTEIERIRGLTGSDTSGGFATLMSRFNAASEAARAGDQDAAKSLPQLSQALITAAGQVATSRQELDRVQAETAASLEATYAAVSRMSVATGTSTDDQVAAAATTTQAAGSSAAANDGLMALVQQLKEEVAAMRNENNAGHADTASAARRVAKKFDDVTDASGGDAVSVMAAA
ncbi:MAG: phage tail length tape measure family protein [Sphingomonas phyllosphaerae]|uniref:phage tail length tape measure family protein n=1 Tax=Sphingomonas phyllosphaerae TaxID=257003 RepID=UPI002FFA7E85